MIIVYVAHLKAADFGPMRVCRCFQSGRFRSEAHVWRARKRPPYFCMYQVCAASESVGRSCAADLYLALKRAELNDAGAMDDLKA